jgi:hypothetical protein
VCALGVPARQHAWPALKEPQAEAAPLPRAASTHVCGGAQAAGLAAAPAAAAPAAQWRQKPAKESTPEQGSEAAES